MLKLNLDNANLDLSAYADQLPQYRDQLLNRSQGWLDLPETAPTSQILTYAESVKGQFEHLVVLGIGGSALGVNALFKALKHYYWNNLSSDQRQGYPQLHVLDNIDPAVINDIQDVIDPAKTLFIVITKSGSTPETISQYLYFRKLAPKENFVFITDPKKGLLRQIATEQGIPTFDIPENVGGRFSVLTPVGLLPAALLGIDITNLLKGAGEIRDNFLSQEFATNPAYQLAVLQYELNTKHNININVLMPYSSPLFTIADWYRQLLAESIGKDGVGITPINALGVTDQHSQIQLYNEGPKDKLIMLIKTLKNSETDNQHVINAEGLPDFAYLNGVTFKKLLDTELTATTQALTKYKTANIQIQIPEISPHTIGQLFMLFELATGLLGELFQIDAFNQPGVELGKVLTKEKLGG